MDFPKYFMLAVTLALFSIASSQITPTPADKDSQESETAEVDTLVPELSGENSTEFYLKVMHDHSTTSSIVVNWKVPSGYDIRTFIVKTNKRDSSSIITSQPLESDVRTYEIPDLVIRSYYEVCVEASLIVNVTDTNPEGVEDLRIKCEDMFTIAAIRADSILAIFCVILLIAFVLILSYVCYVRARKEFEREKAEDEESLTGSMANGRKPVLLNPMDGPRPRSHIEDEDIPYITPTWEQIERERRAAANV